MGPPVKRDTVIPSSKRKHAAKKQAETSSVATKQQNVLSNAAQQRMLDVFMQAFSSKDQAYDFKTVLQEVKGHLFSRDFRAAFGKPEYLDVYAVRWSAARALAYADIFSREDRQVWFRSVSLTKASAQSSSELLPDAAGRTSNLTDEALNAAGIALPFPECDGNAVSIACIGGGAGAEIAALAMVSSEANLQGCLKLYAIDVADWGMQVTKLCTALSTPLPLSAFASQAVKDANKAVVEPGQFSVTFLHRDILDRESRSLPHTPRNDRSHETDAHNQPDKDREQSQNETAGLFSEVDLVTMMFTLNELFATSMAKTTSLLLHLTDAMRPGAHLVVVDSPGSYSEVKLGKTGELKKYPMKWLLDHTLLNVAGQDRWTKLEDEESLWFRLDGHGKHLKYPVDLENCRYQIHVYRKK